MRAVVCKEFGPPEQLVIEDVPDPTPSPGQVLLDVKAVPVVFPDTLMLEDKYQFKAPPPYTPGGEAAGIVASIGDGVEGIAVGDRVVADLGTTGAYAEMAVAPAETTRVLPDAVGFAESTGLGYAHGTSYYGLKYRGRLQPGESLLVLGAGGNVGMSAVELGKILGARVIAAASTEEKLELCRQLGADDTVNYATEDLKERAKELTGGDGVDVVYDPVGGDYAEAALRAMAWEGRFLVVRVHRRHPPSPAEPHLAEGLRHRRCVLRIDETARARQGRRSHERSLGAHRLREADATRLPALLARGGTPGAARHDGPKGRRQDRHRTLKGSLALASFDRGAGCEPSHPVQHVTSGRAPDGRAVRLGA